MLANASSKLLLLLLLHIECGNILDKSTQIAKG
jgi:hypothetical protein